MMIGTLAALTATAPAQAQAQETFCERLAREAGMTEERVGKGAERIWSTRVMNLAQRFLVGGQTTVSMQMGPLGRATIEDYDRFSRSCQPTKKGIACAIAGPAKFAFSVKDQTAAAAIEDGEAARVEMIGTRITCRNGAGAAP